MGFVRSREIGECRRDPISNSPHMECETLAKRRHEGHSFPTHDLLPHFRKVVVRRK